MYSLTIMMIPKIYGAINESIETNLQVNQSKAIEDSSYKCTYSPIVINLPENTEQTDINMGTNINLISRFIQF